MGGRMQKKGLDLPWPVSNALQASSIEVNLHAHLFLRALSSHFPTTCTKSNIFLYARPCFSRLQRWQVNDRPVDVYISFESQKRLMGVAAQAEAFPSLVMKRIEYLPSPDDMVRYRSMSW
jgi:hypothetical protein